MSPDATLLEWAILHGARVNGLKIAEDRNGERGIYAPRDLHARELCVAVPRQLVVTDADARTRHAAVRRAVRADAQLRPEHQLMLHLVCDRAMLDRTRLGGTAPIEEEEEEEEKEDQQHGTLDRTADDSDAVADAPSFGPWFDALPSDFGALPMCWSSDAALDALLPPTRAAAARCQRAEVHWLRSLLQAVAPRTLAAAEGAWVAAGRPHDPAAWAFATVRSRAFQIRVGGRDRAALCPLIDLINHTAGGGVNAEWGYEEHAGEFCVRATRSVAAGAELLDSYGRKPNAELLLNYGFVVGSAGGEGGEGGAGGGGGGDGPEGTVDAELDDELHDALLPLDFEACCATARGFLPDDGEYAVADAGVTRRRAALFFASCAPTGTGTGIGTGTGTGTGTGAGTGGVTSSPSASPKAAAPAAAAALSPPSPPPLSGAVHVQVRMAKEGDAGMRLALALLRVCAATPTELAELDPGATATERGMAQNENEAAKEELVVAAAEKKEVEGEVAAAAAAAAAETAVPAAAVTATAPVVGRVAPRLGGGAGGRQPGRGITQAVSHRNELAATRALSEMAQRALRALPGGAAPPSAPPSAPPLPGGAAEEESEAPTERGGATAATSFSAATASSCSSSSSSSASTAASAAPTLPSAYARALAASVVASERRVLSRLAAKCDAALDTLAAKAKAEPALAPAVLASAAGLEAQPAGRSSAAVDRRLETRELPGRGRGYIATDRIAAGDRILVETPLVFSPPEGGAESAGETAGAGATAAAAAFRAEVVARVLASPACAALLRPPATYPRLRSNLPGVDDDVFSRTWAAAAANGFEHESTGGGGSDGSPGGGGGGGRPHFLLYSALSIFDHR